jgi:hypothetical protein
MSHANCPPIDFIEFLFCAAHLVHKNRANAAYLLPSAPIYEPIARID